MTYRFSIPFGRFVDRDPERIREPGTPPVRQSSGHSVYPCSINFAAHARRSKRFIALSDQYRLDRITGNFCAVFATNAIADCFRFHHILISFFILHSSFFVLVKIPYFGANPRANKNKTVCNTTMQPPVEPSK